MRINPHPGSHNRGLSFFGLTVTLLVLAVTGCLLGSSGLTTDKLTGVVDCSQTTSLVHLTPATRERLVAHFAANRSWRLTRECGALLASFDSTRSDRVTCQNNATTGIVRCVLRFEPYRYKTYLDLTRFETLCAVGDTEVHITPFRSKDISQTFISRLLVTGSNVWLEVLEDSPREARTRTEEIVDIVGKTVQKVIQEPPNLVISCSTDGLSMGSWTNANSDMVFVKEGRCRGIYFISGFVNPGEPGFVSVVGLTVLSGEHVGLRETGNRDVEYVGFSTNRNTRFYFGSEFMVDGLSVMNQEQTKVEVWFHPTAVNSKERMLCSTQIVAYGWSK